MVALWGETASTAVYQMLVKSSGDGDRGWCILVIRQNPV